MSGDPKLLTREERAAIAERVEAASPLPWNAVQAAIDPTAPIDDSGAWHCYTGVWKYYTPTGTTFWTKEDVALMAASRSDIPRLLAHIEVLEAVLRWYRDATYAEFDAATCECTMGEADIDEGERAREVLK